MWRGLFIFNLVVCLGLVGTACFLSWRLASRNTARQEIRWLLRWSGKGLVFPLVLWALMNVGLSFTLQPFMPQVQAAQNRGGNWLPAFMRVMAVGLFVISSYWSAATLGWALWRAGARLDEEKRSELKQLCKTSLMAMIVPAIVIVLVGGLGSVGLAATLIAAVSAGWGASVVTRAIKAPPMYSRAVARLKLGKYAEAEWEIIRELERCEDDFEGWMMMAELYATHFNDLAEAQNTIAQICEQPSTKPGQFSIALHRLADWHLKLADDPEGARRALQVICDRLPGTHLARMARLRINQLPRSAAEARERRNAAPVPMPALGTLLDEEPAESPGNLDRAQAAELANDCVDRLNRDPNDVSAREKLARLLAEHLDGADQAIEQLKLLLDIPGQPDLKRAEWFSLIAAWHLKYRHDTESGRKALERLIEHFPQTPQAVAARRRLELLNRDQVQ